MAVKAKAFYIVSLQLLKAVQSKYTLKKKSFYFTLIKRTSQDVEWYRIFCLSLLCLSVWKTEHIGIQLCQKQNSMMHSVSVNTDPLLQGSLYASSVTWHSVYPRSSSINANLFMYFEELHLWFDFGHITSQINFQAPDWTV